MVIINNTEYAVRIYCAVFGAEIINTDNIYIDGVYECLALLSERERIALESHFRDGLCYEKVGEIIGGVSGSRARDIVLKALRTLRHPKTAEKMNIDKIVENNKRLLEILQKKDEEITELRTRIKSIEHGYSKKGTLKVEYMDFSPRTRNALLKAGLDTVADILAIGSYDDLMEIERMGPATAKDIISKMREFGYNSWAGKIEEKQNGYSDY